jgi:hypothetical protein
MFYEQQIEAAQSILSAYGALALFYAVLVSLTQAGKTGTYHKLIRDMFADGKIQRAYIVCGSSETELRNQAIEDAITYNADLVDKGKLKVIFHQDFKKTVMNTVNALIVIDESHLDQTQGQQLHQFLFRHGITLDGEPTSLLKSNTYILSVDATPYSELAALTHKETTFKKHVQLLKPGLNYYGLADYERDNLIRPAFDILDCQDIFADLIGERGNKWSLVRIPPSKRGEQEKSAIRSICERRGYTMLTYTSEATSVAITRKEQLAFQKKGISIPCLEDAPEKPTVVVISGRLRAGKVVPKMHIHFVWEGAEKSRTDALVQGLPGRMCGYAFGESKPFIFVPIPSLERHSGKCVPQSELERHLSMPFTIPRNATNLKKGHISSKPGFGKTQSVPLRLTIDTDDDEWLPETAQDISDSQLGQRAKQLLIENKRLIEENQNYSNEQKAEILSFLHSAFPHVRRSNQKKYYESLLQAHQSNTHPGEHISDFPEMTFVFWHREYTDLPGSNPNHIYVVFYTNATAGEKTLEVSHLKSRIPQTNGKSVFSINTKDIPRDFVASGIITIPTSLVQTPEDMEKTLREYIQIWSHADRVDVSACIQSDKDRFTLKKKAFHYKSKDKNDVKTLCQRLATEFGIHMKVSFARSGDETFNVKEIKWD